MPWEIQRLSTIGVEDCCLAGQSFAQNVETILALVAIVSLRCIKSKDWQMIDRLTPMILRKMQEGPEAIARMFAASVYADIILFAWCILLAIIKRNKEG